jgi:hypothetical protein
MKKILSILFLVIFLISANIPSTEASMDGCNGGICTNMEVCFGPWYYPRCFNLCSYPNEQYVSCVHDGGANSSNGCYTSVCGIFE